MPAAPGQRLRGSWRPPWPRSSLGASQIRPPAQSNRRSLVSAAVQLDQLARRRGRHRQPPQRALRMSAARRRGSRARASAVSLPSEARELDARARPAGSAAGLAVGDRRAEALEPDRRHAARMAAQRLDLRAAGGQRRQVGGTRDLARACRWPRAAAPAASASSAPVASRVRRVLGARHDLEGDLGQHRQRAVGAGEQLAQIVAGDVLDHPAAGLDLLAVAGDAVQAEQMVARGARP